MESVREQQTMAAGVGCSTVRQTDSAIDEAIAQAKLALGNRLVDLAVVFSTASHRQKAQVIADALVEKAAPRVMMGCTAESIVANGREVEGGDALVVWLASLPGVALEPAHLDYQQTREGGAIIGWSDAFVRDWPAGSALLVFGDPFTFPVDQLLDLLNDEHPGVPVVGGMASGASQPGGNALWLNGFVHHRGAVAVRLSGAFDASSVVSQGCRPIGRPYVVTQMHPEHENVLLELGGKPALEQLQEVFSSLPTHEQRMLQQGIHLGRVIDERRETFSRGDFLIRNVIGADPDAGAVAIGDRLGRGQTVQFHVRDATAADEDLRELLAAARQKTPTPAAGLLFTCNGRGSRLFSQEDHDASAVRSVFADLPLAGFFAAGEIGPIGGRNFLHGFTASLLLFAPRSET